MEQHPDSYHYAGLIFQNLRGEATAAEQQQLQAWLDEDERNRALYASFQETENLAAGMAFQDSIDVAGDWEAVLLKASPAPARRRPLWHSAVTWTAAAAVIGAAIWVYQWRMPPTPDKQVIADQTHTFKNDVLPGSNQAVLQLGNGQTVALGGQPGKAIREEDGTTINQDSGQLVYHKNNEPATALLYNTLSTARAGQYQLTLEDGTRVWLNAASSLKFPVHFTNGERKVELSGEGYFEVAASASRPFKVLVNHVEVLVLGTHFNIGAYGSTVKATLINGAVKVQLPGNRSWRLSPGQQAAVHNEQVNITPADTDKAIAWKEGIFYFKNDDFRDIMEQVARWYDLDVTYAGTPPVKRISGNISRQARLSQVLEMLNYVSGASFSINGKKVTVTGQMKQ